MRPSDGQPTSREAELILHEVDALPTLAGVAARLIKIGSVDDADFGEIIRLIQTDPALTARVLSLCRRAELGLGSRVTTVERAVVLLGLDAIQALVLSAYVFQWQTDLDRERGTKGGVGGLDRAGFWRHSIAVACAAELIATGHRSLGVRPGEAFVAGLLHDLGKLALDVVLPKAYQRVLELAEHRQADIADIERSVIGLDHHVAGKRLGERWELPPLFIDSMWLHAQALEALPRVPHRKLIALVGLADAMCRSLHLGFSGNHAPPRSLALLCAGLGIESEPVENLAPALIEGVAARCRDLGLGEEPSDRVMLESLKAANRQLSKLNMVMERRSRTAQAQVIVMETVRRFNSRVRARMSTLDVLDEVSASAKLAIGAGPCVLVFEGAPGAPWTVACYDSECRRTAAAMVERVGPGDRRSHPGGLLALAGSNPRMLMERVIECLPDGALGAAPEAMSALTIRADDTAGEEGPPAGDVSSAAVLLHTCERAVSVLGRRHMAAVTGAWAVALESSAFAEGSRYLGEQLAEANRVLVQTQQELAGAQSMARLGELTAGAAHEMNSPLAVISGRCQMLAANVTDAGHRAAAQAAVNASARLTDLVTRLHLIAKPPTARYSAAAVTDIITQSIKRARAATEQKGGRAPLVMIRVTIPERVPSARVDRELLTQALVEIIRNAIESKPREAIEVRVRIDPVDDLLIIEVTDTGCGMSEHALQHAFDPFFSEKAAGRQPGLGLASAAGLVRLHNGSITLESRKGVGTTARITLPEWRWGDAAQGMAA